jgi:hypothetical protein
VQLGGRQDGTGGIDFPVRVSAPDPDDHIMELKMNAAREGARGPFGQVHADTEDFRWADRKRQQIERINYENFIAKSFDLSNPADQQRLEKIFPDYYEKREAEIEQQAELQKTLALIRLRGAQTKKEYQTVYAMMTGRIPIPTGALWQPESWSSHDLKGSFTRGIFSPRRLFQSRSLTARTNLFDPLGPAVGGPQTTMQTSFAPDLTTGSMSGFRTGLPDWAGRL